MKLAPLAFFAFNRPNHTRRALESISSNDEAKDSELFVFIDGPKTSEDKKLIEEVKEVVTERPWCKRIEIFENQENLGCARQVVNVTTRCCKEFGRVIILEDDNFLSPYFLRFLNTALEKYENEERIMDVSGYMYPVGLRSNSSSFMRGSGNWGWGTWQRAWQHFESDGEKLLQMIRRRNLEYELNFHNSINQLRLLKRQIKGEVDTWDIQWYATSILRNGLTLYPVQSLTQNIGFDGTGTNTYRSMKYDIELLLDPIESYPDVIEESKELLDATIKYFRKANRLHIKLYERIKSKLGI